MRSVKFFATLARTCNEILCLHPRLIVNSLRIEVAPIELFIDSRRLELPERFPWNVFATVVLAVAATIFLAAFDLIAELAVLDIWYRGATAIRWLRDEMGEYPTICCMKREEKWNEKDVFWDMWRFVQKSIQSFLPLHQCRERITLWLVIYWNMSWFSIFCQPL